MPITLGGAAVVLTVVVTGCGGGASPPTPSPAENPNRVTISANGVVSPKELVVPPGTRVLFINNHNRPHDMSSDPHPDHSSCPEINQVGVLNSGQRRETGNLVTVRTCGFHDHDSPNDAALTGSIVIR